MFYYLIITYKPQNTIVGNYYTTVLNFLKKANDIFVFKDIN